LRKATAIAEGYLLPEDAVQLDPVARPEDFQGGNQGLLNRTLDYSWIGGAFQSSSAGWMGAFQSSTAMKFNAAILPFGA